MWVFVSWGLFFPMCWGLFVSAITKRERKGRWNRNCTAIVNCPQLSSCFKPYIYIQMMTSEYVIIMNYGEQRTK